MFAPGAGGALARVGGGVGSRDDGGGASGPMAAAVHAALAAFIEHDSYPCVGAKSALKRGSYRLGLYAAMGSDGAVAASTRDLQWFARHADEIDDAYATLALAFDGPAFDDERGFEAALWAHLRGVHEIDARRHGWDPSVSSDPADPSFSFSVGGRAFFVVGMHPRASRASRRFPFPALVCNLHSQFERLRERGRYEAMTATVRARDEALQGEANPELRDFGEASEARQYSGRAHEAGWVAPFEAVDGSGGAAGRHEDDGVGEGGGGCPFASGGGGGGEAREGVRGMEDGRA